MAPLACLSIICVLRFRSELSLLELVVRKVFCSLLTAGLARPGSRTSLLVCYASKGVSVWSHVTAPMATLGRACRNALRSPLPACILLLSFGIAWHSGATAFRRFGNG